MHVLGQTPNILDSGRICACVDKHIQPNNSSESWPLLSVADHCHCPQRKPQQGVRAPVHVLPSQLVLSHRLEERWDGVSHGVTEAVENTRAEAQGEARLSAGQTGFVSFGGELNLVQFLSNIVVVSAEAPRSGRKRTLTSRRIDDNSIVATGSVTEWRCEHAVRCTKCLLWTCECRNQEQVPKLSSHPYIISSHTCAHSALTLFHFRVDVHEVQTLKHLQCRIAWLSGQWRDQK